MAIKMIAVDLDDTLLNDKRQITPGVKEAVAAAQAAGIFVVIASGRMQASSMPLYNALGLHSPLICCNGAYAVSPEGENLFRCPIDDTTCQQVISYAKENGIYIQYFQGSTFFTQDDGEYHKLYQSLAGVTGTVVESLTTVTGGADKLLMIQLPDMLEYLPKVRAAFPQLAVSRSKPFYVEINNPDATKGNALAALAKHYGFDREEVMAIGDGLNDMSMLTWAGASVAMENGVPEVKAACRYMTKSNEQDGVAHAIYTIALA